MLLSELRPLGTSRVSLCHLLPPRSFSFHSWEKRRLTAPPARLKGQDCEACGGLVTRPQEANVTPVAPNVFLAGDLW